MARGLRTAAAPREITRENISKWEQRWPALKALNDATLDKARGYSIAVAECERICGGEKEFKKVAPKWKAAVLWVLGITVEYDHGAKAYRFIDVARHLTDRHQRVLRRHERTHRSEWQRLAVMRDADMSDHQRRLRVLEMHQHNDAAGKLEGQREHARLALERPETLPKIG